MRCAVIDTETISFANLSMFDFGYTVFDTETGENTSEGFVIKEVYESDDFRKAFYYEQNKDLYKEYLESGKVKLISAKDLKPIVNNLLNSKLDVISAFNLPFDLRALNYTLIKYNVVDKHITLDKIEKFAKPLDTAILFAVFEGKDCCFDCFCKKNGYLTKTGGVKTDAETIYKYVRNDITLIEKHTGIDDSIMEADILSYYLIRVSKFPKLLQDAYNYSLRGTKPHQILKKGTDG